MPLAEGWRDQYERMLRSFRNLVNAADSSTLASADVRDALFRFFQDAYQLKDWIKNDPAVPTTAKRRIERHVTRTPALALCADLCNGIKHFSLDRDARTGDRATNITNQSVTIRVGGGPNGETVADHQWYITSNGQRYDALEQADAIVDEWEAWLKGECLL